MARAHRYPNHGSRGVKRGQAIIFGGTIPRLLAMAAHSRRFRAFGGLRAPLRAPPGGFFAAARPSPMFRAPFVRP